MWEMNQIICIAILTILSVMDICYRKVPQLLLIIGSIGVVCFQYSKGGVQGWVLGAGICVGILFLLLSKVTQEGIGYGDSWGILILGGFLGVWGVLEVLLVAFLLLIVVGIFCLVTGRLGRKTTLPFYPFLTVGYVVTVVMGVFSL